MFDLTFMWAQSLFSMPPSSFQGAHDSTVLSQPNLCNQWVTLGCKCIQESDPLGTQGGCWDPEALDQFLSVKQPHQFTPECPTHGIASCVGTT